MNREEALRRYYLNPKICLNCGEIIRVRDVEHPAEKKKKFEEKTLLCILEFETSEKDIVNYESYALFKGMSNDTLGHYNS